MCSIVPSLAAWGEGGILAMIRTPSPLSEDEIAVYAATAAE